MDRVIELERLTHRYGSRTALNDLNLVVNRGEVLGLLGPNGAGKTTSVRLVNGLFRPSSGQIRVLGFNPATQGEKVRRLSGVLTETPALYERLTARQNLSFFGTMCDLSGAETARRCAELLAFFELTARADERVGAYSKGMKQRLALARALLHHPPLLFLDEPTSGLDPEAAAQVHDLIAGLRAQDGQTVWICTHNLYEAGRLCDRLAIINRGELLALGTLEELRRQVAPETWVTLEMLAPLPTLEALLRSLPGVVNVQPDGSLRADVHVRESAAIPPLVTALAARGAQIVAVRPKETTLEEIYFKLQEQHREKSA